jgi:hypothetical protein
MRIIKIVGKKKLKKLYKESEGKILYALISGNIDFDETPKKMHLLDFGCLIPPPSVVEIFAEEGGSSDYKYNYLRYLSSPSERFVINELLFMALTGGADVGIMCSLDDDEFGYIDILCEFIKSMYPVHIVGLKKYLTTKEKIDPKKEEKLLRIVEDRREKLIQKLHDSYLDPVKIMGLIMRKPGTKFSKGYLSIDEIRRRKKKK